MRGPLSVAAERRVGGRGHNLVFQPAPAHYETASNLPFARCGEVFGDTAIAAAMIDRIVHHAEIISTKGASCRI